MVPQSILDKMRLGVGASGLVWALGYSGCGLAEEGEKKTPSAKPPAAEKEAPKLTEDQLKTLRAAMPKLGAEKFEAREEAHKTILALGKGALEPLREALKTSTEVEVKNGLNRLIVELSPKPSVVKREACEGCGKG